MEDPSLTTEQRAASGDIFAYGGNMINSQTGVSTPVKPSSPVILSTTQGAQDVQQGQQTLDQIGGQVDTRYQKFPTESVDQYNARVKQYYSQPEQKTQPQGSSSQSGLPNPVQGDGNVSYINPATGQTQAFTASSLTPDQVDSLMSQGYSIMDSNGTVPSWITSGNTELGRATLAATKSENDLNTLKGQLSSFTVSDQQLQGQIDSISKLWDARIQDMKSINERRVQSLNTTGIRLGSQYTGGAGGVFGGIISEEERQGVARIAELEATKQSAIAAAREAARTKNWEVFSKQLSMAETAYTDKQNQLKELAKAAAEQSKKIADQAIQASRDSAIADLVSQGITDPGTILNYLNYDNNGNLSGDFTAEEVSKTLKSVLPAGFDDIAKTASKNGAPPDVIKSILSSKNASDAYLAAGSYMQEGTGIVGEYQYYKRQAEASGQIPVDFNTYQNIDANRKAKIAAAGIGAGTDLNTKEAAIFNSLVDKYNKSPLVAAYDRTITLRGIIDKIKDDPTNGALQLSLVYGYVQALDTYQSAVREGELGLVNSIDSKIGKLQNSVEKVQNGQIVREDVINQISAAAQSLVDTISDGAKNKQKTFSSQARQNGTNVYNAFEGFISAVNDTETTGDSLIKSDAEAEQKVTEYGSSNPDKQSLIRGLVTENDPELGRPLTFQEVLEVLGIQ